MKRFTITLSLVFLSVFLLSDVYAQSVRKARDHIKKNKFDKAKEEAEKVIAKDPAEAEAYFILGHAMGALGDVDAMDANFEKCRGMTNEFNGRMNVERDKMHGVNFTAGLQSLTKADKEDNPEKAKPSFEDAIMRFSAAVKIRSDDTQSKQYMAYSYLSTGDVPNAEKYYKEVLAEDPENAGVLKNLGIISFERAYNQDEASVYPDVVKYYEKLIGIVPEELSVIGEQLLAAYESTNEFEKGLQIIERLLTESPDNPNFTMWKGNFQLQNGDDEAALETFKKAAAFSPENTQLLVNIAFMPYQKLEEMKGADKEVSVEQWKAVIPSMEKLTTLTPKDPDVWRALFRMYMFIGEEEKAEKAYAEWQKLIDPDR
ncbi:tetratricopeptide repeat protein [candidate division KSB1 bacterium]